ncbi:MAG: hypothetical protein WBF23_08590, partial [Methyloceanibacter sp.]
MIDTQTLRQIALAWAVVAYLIVPRLWVAYFRRHPLLTQLARITQTGDGHPGDPINLALLGTDEEL